MENNLSTGKTVIIKKTKTRLLKRQFQSKQTETRLRIENKIKMNYERSKLLYKLKAEEKLIAGCVSGVITRFITQPLDIIKLRTQLTKKKKGVARTTVKIFEEEGISAFFQGHTIGQIHSVLAVSSQFYVYELLTKYASTFELSKPSMTAVNLICGAFAGAASATMVTPLEVIRIRQMLVKEQYGGLINGIKTVYRYGGFFAFYEGLSASILQMGPQVAISFSVFSTLQPFILKLLDDPCPKGKQCTSRPEFVALASSIAGSAAGFASKSLTYPLDLAKRRLQIASHKSDTKYNVPSTAAKLFKCHSIKDCMVKTFRKEGWKGLFRGWSVTVYKAQVTSVVAFTSYELVCFAIRSFKQK